MNKNALVLIKENQLSFTLNQDIKTKTNIQYNLNQNELSKIFNTLYDSNFLILINELSTQIQSLYKSSNNNFSLIKAFFENENNENKQQHFTDIQNNFNNLESLMSQFYSSAKVLFKKMKFYRNEKMKSFDLIPVSRIHKRSNTNLNDKNGKNKTTVPLLNFENIKNTANINKVNSNSGWESERSQKNQKQFRLDTINDLNTNNLNNSNNTNINFNNSSNSNNFSQSCNTTVDKESNIFLIEEKNQCSNSNLSFEYYENLSKEIQTLEEAILPYEENNSKIIDIINNIKKIVNSMKINLSNNNLSHENQDKNNNTDVTNKINTLNEENNNIKKQFEKYKSEEKTKRKFLENQIINLSNKISEYEKAKKKADKKLKEMNNKYEEEISMKYSELKEEIKTKEEKIKILEEKIKENEEYISNKDKDIVSLQKNIKAPDIKPSMNNENENNEIIKLKELNDKYNSIIKNLQKENKDIINNYNKELVKKEELIQEYKKKYENEIKNNKNANIDEQNMGENNDIKLRRYKNTNNIPIPKRNYNLEDNEKKYRFLYNTINNFNKKKTRNNSSNLYSSSNAITINTNPSENDINGLLNSSGKKSKINSSYNSEQNKNIDIDQKNNVYDNIINKINPENYSIIKIYQYNSKLRWILFKKNKKANEVNHIRYNLGNNKKIKTIYKIDYDYEDFIWCPYKDVNAFSEFGDLSLFKEKEKEYDNIIIKLNQKNKIYESYIEKLKNENLNLNNMILKYKSEVKEDKNFIGVSFIDEDPEGSKFFDDKCCEDILKGLDKNKENTKIKGKENCHYNINLKNSIDMLMTKVIPSENVISLISSILRQLGCSDEDIVRLIGNHRGVIQIPSPMNKQRNK